MSVMSLPRSAAMALLLAFLLALAADVSADSWLPPKKHRYCSANGAFCVDVDPKPIESQLRYFEDHVKGAENPGAGAGKPRTATATLLERNEGKYRPIRSFPLSNEVAPVSALVSHDGQYLVTFDNWHSVGWGDSVVVIYRSDGSMVRKYSLAQLLSEKKVRKLPRSVSSIWWGGEHRLDERSGHLVLQIVAAGTKMFDENAKYSELRIRLASGEKVTK